MNGQFKCINITAFTAEGITRVLSATSLMGNGGWGAACLNTSNDRELTTWFPSTFPP